MLQCFSDSHMNLSLPPRRISYIIYPLLADLGPPFVDYAGHYSSVCPIGRLPKSSMSCGNQDSTVQGSSPHKCGQGVWWDALNVVAATIPPITSGLTPSLKLFLYSVAPSGNVPLTWPCSGLTILVYGLLGIVLASSAFGMTRDIITLLNFCIPQL